MRISDWSSDVCSSDLCSSDHSNICVPPGGVGRGRTARYGQRRTAVRSPRHSRRPGECGDDGRRWHPCTSPGQPSRRSRVPFKVGDKVVYPHHGAAIIEGTDTITMPDGAKTKYFVLRMTHGDLMLK